jgi:hypothetical protein
MIYTVARRNIFGGPMENKLKHLELVQGVINRLSTNSFLLKGWSVVLVSGLFVVSASDSRPGFVLLAYVPAFIFWGLDGYYLWQERLYRKLFDFVRLLDATKIDFSMDAYRFRDHETRSWVSATLSTTLISFHGVLILAVIVVMILVLYKGA